MDEVPMTMSRFREIVESYGGNPDRWPAGERAAATTLASRPEGRALLDRAAGLDGLLDTAPVPAPASQALVDRLLAVAEPEPDPVAVAEDARAPAEAHGLLARLRLALPELAGLLTPARLATQAAALTLVAGLGVVVGISESAQYGGTVVAVDVTGYVFGMHEDDVTTEGPNS